MSQKIKQKLRNKYLATLKSLDVEQKSQWDESIFQQFIASCYFQEFNVFALYFSLPYEVDTISIINVLLEKQKKVALPRMKEQSLEFYYINSLSDLVVDNKWNILQPKATNQIVASEDLEVIILPLVAFNQNYQRLGHGKGYYDRYLSQPNVKAVKLILAYKIQEISHDIAFSDPWDINFDAIITN